MPLLALAPLLTPVPRVCLPSHSPRGRREVGCAILFLRAPDAPPTTTALGVSDLTVWLGIRERGRQREKLKLPTSCDPPPAAGVNIGDFLRKSHRGSQVSLGPSGPSSGPTAQTRPSPLRSESLSLPTGLVSP